MSILPPGPDSKTLGPVCTCAVNPQPHRHPRVDNALAAAEAWAEREQDDEDDCGHHSWAGLMALLDEHWPDDIFPTREDDIRRDAGARIISLLRWVDRLRGER